MDLDRFYEARPVARALIGTSDEERGLIVSASNALADLLACDCAALVGRALVDFVHPDDRRRARKEFARLVVRGRATYDGVGRLLAANGDVRWLTVHASLAPDCERQRLAVHALAMPVRPLSVKVANARRTSSTDRLGVALDLEPAALTRSAA
ncbi:MAG TPA: PAS domain-containing protein [Solirubrobacteraceae bacterium]|jgi:PAS domain S-box-containing protein|nr:PAS domain-containing protein [Solirubrobacteraceae bacterium]